MTEEQKAKRREYNRKYYREHREKIAAYAKKYWKKHREEINARNRKRWATDPDFRARQKKATKKWLAKPGVREYMNAFMREYMKRPYAAAARREYESRPEVKQRRAAYRRGYDAGMRRAKRDFMKQVTTRVIHEFTKG